MFPTSLISKGEPGPTVVLCLSASDTIAPTLNSRTAAAAKAEGGDQTAFERAACQMRAGGGARA